MILKTVGVNQQLGPKLLEVIKVYVAYIISNKNNNYYVPNPDTKPRANRSNAPEGHPIIRRNIFHVKQDRKRELKSVEEEGKNNHES